MIRTFGAVMLGLALAGPVQGFGAADRQVMGYCAAQFDARARWLAAMGDAPGAARMHLLREQLLAKAKAEDSGRPAAMPATVPALPPLSQRSLTIQTGFAEAGGMRDCASDALCLACSELADSLSR